MGKAREGSSMYSLVSTFLALLAFHFIQDAHPKGSAVKGALENIIFSQTFMLLFLISVVEIYLTTFVALSDLSETLNQVSLLFRRSSGQNPESENKSINKWNKKCPNEELLDRAFITCLIDLRTVWVGIGK